MKKSLIVLLLAGVLSAVYAAKDISGYKLELTSAGNETNLLGDGSFEDGGKGWVAIDKKRFSVKRGDGYNGTSGIKLTVYPGSKRILPHKWYDVKLKKGVRYKLSGYGRVDGNVNQVQERGAKVSGRMLLEYWDGRKYIRGFGSSGGIFLKDWKKFSRDFVLSDDIPDTARFKVLIVPSCPAPNSNIRGAIYFDEISLTEDTPRWFVSQVYPIAERLYGHEGFIRFSSTFSGQHKGAKAPEYQVKVTRNGKVLAVADAKVQGARVTAELGKLTPGKAEVTVTLYNSKDKKIYGVQTIPVLIVGKEQMPSYACTVDRLGRAIVNGKPFMPIGLYVIGNRPAKRVADIAKSGVFNTVLLYHTIRFNTQPAMNAFLDACSKNNIKLLFASKFHKVFVKAVEANKHHPAILGWYIDDETSVSKLPQLIANRRLINKIDPWRPTYAVTCFPDDFEQYIKSCDIFGYDPYPIRETSANPTLRGVKAMSDPAERLDAFSWAVPQIFSWGSYDREAKKNKELFLKKFREPTEKQIRGIVITEAIAGSKGFIMYMYCTQIDHGNPDPTAFKRRWPEICRVAGELKALTPFIMSDIERLKLAPADKKGEVRAALFDDGKGEIRVLVCGLDSVHDSVITLPEKYRGKQLKSKFGHVKPLGNGKYHFTGKEFAADILY